MADFSKRLTTALILSLSFLFIIFYLKPLVFSLILIAILFYILMYEWPQLWEKNPRIGWLLAPLYPIMPFCVLIILNQNYHLLIFPLFALTAAFDTGAYIIGSLMGFHKIVPSISPGKSWEGFIGGYVNTTAVLYAFSWYHDAEICIVSTLLISLIMCTLAFFGDLFESWLKRRAHIKDTSTALPGHGGFLDRLDSVLFVALFFYLFRLYLMTYNKFN